SLARPAPRVLSGHRGAPLRWYGRAARRIERRAAADETQSGPRLQQPESIPASPSRSVITVAVRPKTLSEAPSEHNPGLMVAVTRVEASSASTVRWGTAAVKPCG